MKSIQQLWNEFAVGEQDCLARCADELLDWVSTGDLANWGLVRTFAAQLRHEGFPADQTLQLAEDCVKRMALVSVSMHKKGVVGETGQP